MGNLKYSFTDKNVLVTGGAQGIGFEISKLFLQADANVTIADYSSEGLQVAARELAAFPKLKTMTVDVCDRQSCQKLAEATENLHVLVNNAGIIRDKSFARLTDEDFDKVIQTNLTGVYNITKAMLPKFADSKTPKRIVNMASVVALYGNFGQTNYVAAKAGVVGMTKTWAKELSRKGFTVNAIAPGFIRTPMTASMPADVLTAMEAKVPVGRLGEPADIANAAIYLSSDEAAYINGAILCVDGGLVL